MLTIGGGGGALFFCGKSLVVFLASGLLGCSSGELSDKILIGNWGPFPLRSWRSYNEEKKAVLMTKTHQQALLHRASN